MKTNKQFLMLDYDLLRFDDIDMESKVIIATVVSLSKTEDGCYISNKFLADMLGFKNGETVSRKVSKLVKLGYLHYTMETCSYGTRRKMYPTHKVFESRPLVKTVKTPPLKIVKTSPAFESIPPPNLSQDPSPQNSQPIRLDDYINTLDQPIISDNNISTIILQDKNIMKALESLKLEDKVFYAMTAYLKNGNITKSQREMIIDNKIQLSKIKVLQPILEKI